MAKWRVEFDVWAFSTGEGADKDQKKVGDKVQKFEVTADEIEDALYKANLIKTGIKTNPAVWRVRVRSVTEAGY